MGATENHQEFKLVETAISQWQTAAAATNINFAKSSHIYAPSKNISTQNDCAPETRPVKVTTDLH